MPRTESAKPPRVLLSLDRETLERIDAIRQRYPELTSRSAAVRYAVRFTAEITKAGHSLPEV